MVLKYEKLLLLGSSGLFGINFQKNTNYDKKNIIRIARKENHFFVDQLADISNRSESKEIISKYKPDIILHSIAISSHKECSNNPELALKINLKTVENIVEFAPQGCKIVFLSSDSVFSGVNKWYKEVDKTDPFSLYGELKVKAENVIRNNIENHIILRGSFYGTHPTNKNGIFDYFYFKLKNNQKVEGYTDIVSNSIDLRSLTKIIESLIIKDFIGTIHYGTLDSYSKFDLACFIANQFNFDKSNIVPIESKFLNSNVNFPRDLSLDISKLIRLDEKFKIYIKDSIKQIVI